MLGYGDVPPSQGMLLHQCVLSGYSFSTTYAPVFAQGMKFLTKVSKIFSFRVSFFSNSVFSGYIFPRFLRFHDFQGIYLKDIVCLPRFRLKIQRAEVPPPDIYMQLLMTVCTTITKEAATPETTTKNSSTESSNATRTVAALSSH